MFLIYFAGIGVLTASSYEERGNVLGSILACGYCRSLYRTGFNPTAPGMTVLIAPLSYRIYERLFLQLKRRFTSYLPEIEVARVQMSMLFPASVAARSRSCS